MGLIIFSSYSCLHRTLIIGLIDIYNLFAGTVYAKNAVQVSLTYS